MKINMNSIFLFVFAIFYVLSAPFAAAQEEPAANAELFRVEVSPEPPQESGQGPVPEITATPFEPDKVPETAVSAEPQPPVRTTIPSYRPDEQRPAEPESVQVRRTISVVPPMATAKSGKTYRVQLGSYSNTAIAQDCFDRVKNAGFTPAVEPFGSLYRVVIPGVYAEDLPGYIQRLENAGFTEAWLREEN
jgi:cell division protein FtsN